MNATVERRLLINYRVDPTMAERWLPDGFRLQLVDGYAVAGICMIRLAHLAPRGVPSWLGWGAENAAQRIAVEWGQGETAQRGVYIPRRFSASRLAVSFGGRLFPGVHAKADISSEETSDRVAVTMHGNDGTIVEAAVQVSDTLADSVFQSVDEASEFFRQGSVGWSPGRRSGDLDGLRLATDQWRVEPTVPIAVRSSFFDSLPAGAAELDSVLVMRNIPAVWHAVPQADHEFVG